MAATEWRSFTDQTNKRMAEMRKAYPAVAKGFAELATAAIAPGVLDSKTKELIALAIGAYIIKMRRRRFEVPFSALWKRVLEQKDANALWKQLKRLMSLLLILLILAIVGYFVKK